MAASFAARLQRALLARQWRPADLARAVGASRAAVTHWTSGRSEPKGEFLTAIADALRVNAAWLARGSGSIEGPSNERASTPRAPPRSEGAAHRPTPKIATGIDEELSALTMDLAREIADLVRAWIALPEVERDRFKAAIEAQALQYRRSAPDARLGARWRAPASKAEKTPD